MNGTHAGLPEIFRTKEFVGWEVVDAGGEKAGTVADLLIDATGRVRFIDVEYGFPRKHVLIPQERLEWGERRVVIDAWAREGLKALPPYDPSRALDRGMVEEMRRAYPAVYDAEAHDWRAPASGEARVVPLTEAKDFRLEKGAPDLRGWNVFGSDGERVGVVSQLLVDPGAMKIRYLDIDVHEDLFRLKDDRHVVVPLEHVDLRERGKDVWVEGLPAASIALLPAYTGGPVSTPLERAIDEAFSGATRPQLGASARDDGFVREEFGPVDEDPRALEGPVPEPYPADEPQRDP